MNSGKPRRWRFGRLAARALLSVVVTLWIIFDDTVGFVLRPAFSRLANLPFIARIEHWTTTLRPYPTLAFFLVPLIVIEPAKLAALLLLGRRHYISGVLLMGGAFAVGLAVVDRIFALNRDKLLTIGWFARCYFYLSRLRDVLYRTARRTVPWHRVKRAASRFRVWLVTRLTATGRRAAQRR